jgi:hypothetical protein
MGSALVVDVIPRVLAVRDGPTLADHPGIEVFRAAPADGDDPFVAIDIALLASNRRPPDLVGERQSGLLSATGLIASFSQI